MKKFLLVLTMIICCLAMILSLAACGETTTDEPGDTEQPGTDDPGTDDPGTDDPGTDDPGTDDPGKTGLQLFNEDGSFR